MTELPSMNPTQLSVARGDLPYRLQRSAGLVPKSGKDGVTRRIILYTGLAWAPLVIWALVEGRAFEGGGGEPLVRHLALHARLLVALPLLIYGEKVAHAVMKRLLPRFVSSGLVTPEKVPAYQSVIAEITRLRDSVLPWVVICGISVATILIPETGRRLNELSWARDPEGLGFGGWWYLCVSRPLLQIFLLGWLWRIALITILMRRIVKLGLRLAPAHPDGLGGLGFIEGLPRMFLPLGCAMSCVLAAQAAHDVMWHGVHVGSLKMQGAGTGVLIMALCFVPLLVFVPLLKKTKRKSVAEYADLAAHHERLAHDQWTGVGEAPDPGTSNKPKSLADLYALFNNARSMRVLPFSYRSLLVMSLPVALPILAVGAIEIPVADLVGKIFKTIF